MDKALYIFDLDGVLYRGNTAQPFAAETISTLKSTGRKVFYLTNNASVSRQNLADKLNRMGISASPDECMTSSYATGLWFQEFGYVGQNVLVVGEQGCKDELRRAGMHILDDRSEDPVHFVVVGIDRSFSYEKLHQAQQAILNGATFIATNRDPTYPLEGGVSPGGGSIVAAVATAVGNEPITIGKPETYTIKKILELTKVSADQAAMVGDRLDTDILVGNRAGVLSILVMGGVTTREEAESAADGLKPEIIIESLYEIIGPLAAAKGKAITGRNPSQGKG